MRTVIILLALCGAALAQTKEDVDLYNLLAVEWENKYLFNVAPPDKTKSAATLAAEKADLARRISEVKARINAAGAKK